MRLLRETARGGSSADQEHLDAALQVRARRSVHRVRLAGPILKLPSSAICQYERAMLRAHVVKGAVACNTDAVFVENLCGDH